MACLQSTPALSDVYINITCQIALAYGPRRRRKDFRVPPSQVEAVHATLHERVMAFRGSRHSRGMDPSLVPYRV